MRFLSLPYVPGCIKAGFIDHLSNWHQQNEDLCTVKLVLSAPNRENVCSF